MKYTVTINVVEPATSADVNPTRQIFYLEQDELDVAFVVRALTAKKRGRKLSKPGGKSPNLPLEQ